MDFGIFNSIITFFQANIPVAIVAAVLIAFLAYKKPKLFFTAFFIALLLVGVFYLITYLSDTGGSYKKTLIERRTIPFK